MSVAVAYHFTDFDGNTVLGALSVSNGLTPVTVAGLVLRDFESGQHDYMPLAEVTSVFICVDWETNKVYTFSDAVENELIQAIDFARGAE